VKLPSFGHWQARSASGSVHHDAMVDEFSAWIPVCCFMDYSDKRLPVTQDNHPWSFRVLWDRSRVAGSV
jgi:hypothetical protein